MLLPSFTLTYSRPSSDTAICPNAFVTVYSVVVPIPKSKKDSTISDNYRPIALAPNLSKVLEWCFVLNYSFLLMTSDLKFGFKPGFSSDLCSIVLKNIVSKYLHSGLLAKRNLPAPLLAFL